MTMIIDGSTGLEFPDGSDQTSAFTGNASSITSGTLSVARGGTGSSVFSDNTVLLGNGTGALQTVSPGTSGNVLTSDGFTWVSQALPAGGVTSLNGQTGAITNTDLGAIGSYVGSSVVPTAAPGTTAAGSSLTYSYYDGSSNVYISLGLSGTWRFMGGRRSTEGGALTSGAASLWVRIS